ncbi:MAG: aminotransferase class I/II-fold pyridoxal phosphate-dependent enzyme [Planctomycetes bacterium]|nr:aminotransferase class I/II-fold pyridoxal phosphate-dependent enzyme [Planctomycetota bacterium]
MRPRGSAKAARFGESVIREMSRVCAREGGVNLAQGFPDFPAPLPMKEAAKRAIDADKNQYAVTWGAPALRAAIARRATAERGLGLDPDRNVTVCCGATEAMIATLLATTDPGDEVVIFAPFYENYGPDCVLSGAKARWVALRAPDWSFDPDELARAFGPRTRAVIVNTPHNPTGKVFTRAELEIIAALCLEHDALAITDEIYEYILYDGAEHVALATLPDMAERTVTISGLSKTWSATGWRIGWCLASPDLTLAIRKVHDFLTVGAPAPLQEAAAEALGFGPEYFRGLVREYHARRDALVGVLDELGFRVFPPRGAYYVMTGVERFQEPGEDDTAFAMRLVSGGGVATVPGSSFFPDPADGRHLIRFCFAKRLETLRGAAALLRERLA